MDIEQILSILIFSVMFIAVVWGKIHRCIPALIGGGATIILILAVVHPGPELYGTCCGYMTLWIRTGGSASTL